MIQYSIIISAAGFIVGFIFIVIGYLIEKKAQAQKQNFSDLVFNIVYFLPASFLQNMLAPFAGAMTTYVAGVMGGGLIALQASGWRLIADLLLYLLAMDFGEYIFHRAQHRFAFLWSMHALHHSDKNLNISTTVRQYWADHFIKSAIIYLPIGLIFKLNLNIVSLYGLISFYNYFSHMNLKLGFGRWSMAINSPQYHRIHHSILTEHRDCNFAALFPVFDYIFGSYRHPQPDEFPLTGLESNEEPSSLLEAVVWPIRSLPARIALKRTQLSGSS